MIIPLVANDSVGSASPTPPDLGSAVAEVRSGGRPLTSREIAMLLNAEAVDRPVLAGIQGAFLAAHAGDGTLVLGILDALEEYVASGEIEPDDKAAILALRELRAAPVLTVASEEPGGG